jgi:hypothetical protein
MLTGWAIAHPHSHFAHPGNNNRPNRQQKVWKAELLNVRMGYTENQRNLLLSNNGERTERSLSGHAGQRAAVGKRVLY